MTAAEMTEALIAKIKSVMPQYIRHKIPAKFCVNRGIFRLQAFQMENLISQKSPGTCWQSRPGG